MRGEIRKKIGFLEIVSKGEEEVIRYFDDLGSDEEKTKFFQLVNWGKKSNCVVGLNSQNNVIVCDDPKLTQVGKEVYEGRKDLIL